MFNNFVKSMMALCMVTSGWSSLDGVLKDGTSGNLEDLFEKANEEELLHKESDAIRNTTSSDLDSSNFSEGSIGPVDEATQTDEVGAVDSPDLNSSNSSGGSIEKVDVETQTIEEVKSPSTTSETMNKSINTVGTLEIEGHSSGEEGGSGSDNFQHNKDADTSTSSEEGTETQTENNEKRLVQPGCANYGQEGDQSGEVVALVDLLDGDQTLNDNSLYTFDEDYQVDGGLMLVGEFLANIDSSPNGARKNKIVDQLKDLVRRDMIKLDANYSYDLFDALSAYIDVWFDEVPSMGEIICALGKVTNQDTAKDKANVKEIIQSIKRQLCRAYY